jgi:UDP-N-acetylmuramyl pentapeptide phosphotransferase/UDP-N-acetylglucosamine-1-phosphate transferase
MKRTIGIGLILVGIGILIGSGYLFPKVIHKLDLGENILVPSPSHTNLVPYISGVIIFIGLVVLLSSKDNLKKQL